MMRGVYVVVGLVPKDVALVAWVMMVVGVGAMRVLGRTVVA
jgi:hypothetical protein